MSLASTSIRRPMPSFQHDEKSQIQAIDRTQPGLPMKKRRCAILTHDYKRNGTTTLFAAPNVLEGEDIGRCMQRHRHQEFIRLLNAVEREASANKAVHAVLNNYATHKHLKGDSLAAAASALHFPLHPDFLLLVCSPSSPGSGSNAASSHRSSNCRLPSTASPPKQTTSPSRSSGPNPPTSFSLPCSTGGKR
jgi:hypothetical protein